MPSDEARKAAKEIISRSYDAVDSSTPIAQIIDAHMQPKWIGVEERLPEAPFGESNADPILWCYVKQNGEGVTYPVYIHYGTLKFYGFDDYDMECPMLGVTHWLPLPEPPKE